MEIDNNKKWWKDAGLRYYSYSHFLHSTFGKKIYRTSVDAGFSCPNVDGSVAKGGCIYCDNSSFVPASKVACDPVQDQIDTQIKTLKRRYKPDAYFAYFQAASNTYASVDKLKALYDDALAHPEVIGLVVSTRPDVVTDEVLDLLENYAKSTYVSVEYGLQSIHNKSLEWMNRGHTAEAFFDTVERTKNRGIHIGSHVILGLPGESHDEMMATAKALTASAIDCVKIHNLHIVKETRLATEHEQNRIKIFERDEYAELVVDFLEHLGENIIIGRLMGDAPRDHLITPTWSQKKAAFLIQVDKIMAERNTLQGRRVTT